MYLYQNLYIEDSLGCDFKTIKQKNRKFKIKHFLIVAIISPKLFKFAFKYKWTL